ncbi:protein of unknown function [Paraburkholderia dioscoreae]|uniref:Uncharacterized protein n=1 Tax=Paraburkholderia dioscoreae TaxID=2604047 RepID=A0A5Q4ZK90_9BURK|nr:protein of unknown function [Paraburkholderia dioscoreae]
MSIYFLDEARKKRILVRCSQSTSKRSTIDFRTTKKRSTTNISGHLKREMLTHGPRVAGLGSLFFQRGVAERGLLTEIWRHGKTAARSWYRAIYSVNIA